jgi:hypothetical protein
VAGALENIRAVVNYGTITVWVEGTEDEVQERTEKVIAALNDLDFPMSVSEDVGEYETA